MAVDVGVGDMVFCTLTRVNSKTKHVASECIILAQCSELFAYLQHFNARPDVLRIFELIEVAYAQWPIHGLGRHSYGSILSSRRQDLETADVCGERSS